MKRIRICFYCHKPIYIFDSACSPNGNKTNLFAIHPGCKAALKLGATIPRKASPEHINYLMATYFLMKLSTLEEDVL